MMIERIRKFLLETPGIIAMLRQQDGAEEYGHLLEQQIHGLKERAMAIGATSVADELFSFLMQIRKKEGIRDAAACLDTLVHEFDRFSKEPRIVQLTS